MKIRVLFALGGITAMTVGGCPIADVLPSLRDALPEGARIGTPMLQDDIAEGRLTLKEIRERGMKIFTMPFSIEDGYGDGPMNPDDTISPGGRPTLQNNGVFLRVNGLDAQSCLECHSITSNATIPATLGIGGVGSANNNAIIMPRRIDSIDEDLNGFAGFDGRFANPPFLFGSGGVELLGKEMTADLQALRQQAEDNPGTRVDLISKGLSFGSIIFEDGELDTSDVRGIDADLVVKPFGRKGEFASVRAFDQEAMMFHFGMQPTEVVGEDFDSDGDGVVNEVMPGDMTALHVFNTTLKRPLEELRGDVAAQGRDLFSSVGCANCHVPALTTERRTLPLSFPEVPTDPFANEFFAIDLAADRPGFDLAANGGVIVPLFSDLRRHDMGEALAESFGKDIDGEFITARLWGIADTAPYLHDGRALTLRDAILLHGGEAQAVRDNFANLSEAEQDALIEYLRSLRTPLDATSDLE